MTNFKELGTMNGHGDVELFEKDGIIYACSHWNGEVWNDCWIADKYGTEIKGSKKIDYIRPEYEHEFDEDGDILQSEIIDIEVW